MIKYYETEEFRQCFESYFRANEAVYQLIMGNAHYVDVLREKGEEIDANTRFGAIFVDDEPEFFFCNMLPYNPIVSAAHPGKMKNAKECAEELAKEFKTSGLRTTGIQAPKEFAEAYVEAYKEKKFKLSLEMDIMIAREIKRLEPKGIVRHALPEDIEQLVPCYVQYVWEALHEKVESEEVREKFKQWFSYPNVRIWVYELDGKIVAHALSTRQPMHSASFNGVYTKPEYRGRGICKELMSVAGLEMMETFETCTLFVDRTNPKSNAAYAAIGYEIVTNAYAYDEV